MRIYTLQISQHRKLKVKYPDIPIFNSTFGSGYKLMAPTWAILGKYKKDQDEAAYIAAFMPLMRERMITDRETWLAIARGGNFGVGCYCNPGKFCHRHLLVQLFEEFCKQENIPFENMGELFP